MRVLFGDGKIYIFQAAHCLSLSLVFCLLCMHTYIGDCIVCSVGLRPLVPLSLSYIFTQRGSLWRFIDRGSGTRCCPGESGEEHIYI